MSTLCSVASTEEISNLIQQGFTYEDISNHYSSLYPSQKGLTIRSVRRFCSVNNINRNVPMGKKEIESVIRTSIDELFLL